MRYKLDFFNGFFYAVPVDAWEIWDNYKRSHDLYGVAAPKMVWVIDNLNDFTFTDPQIQ